MTEFEIALYIMLGWLNGFLLAYIMWAPLTPFKQAFVDGLTLKFLWSKK